MTATLTLIIKDLNGVVCCLTAHPQDLIADVKSNLSATIATGDRSFRLIWQGHVLDDHRTIRSYNFIEATILYLTFIAKVRTPPPAPDLPSRSNGLLPGPNGNLATKLRSGHPKDMPAMLRSLPEAEDCVKPCPELSFALEDTADFRDAFAPMIDGADFGWNLDRQFDRAELDPHTEKLIKRQSDLLLEALESAKPSDPTHMPGSSFAPSVEPLPNPSRLSPTPLMLIPPAPNPATDQARRTIYTLNFFGVDLAAIPGLAELANLAPPPNMERAEVMWGERRDRLKETDIKVIAMAMLASGADTACAEKLIAEKHAREKEFR
jgi:hypothetical protein